MTIAEFLKEKNQKLTKIELALNEKKFFDAVKSGNKDVIRQLVNKGINVNIKDSDGWTALMLATLHGDNDKTVRLLIELGAELDIQNDEGETALMCAIIAKATHSAKLLISNGANVNIKDNNGRTALMLAALNDSRDIGEILILEGANIDSIDSQRMSAFDIAVKTWIFRKNDFFLKDKPIQSLVNLNRINYIIQSMHCLNNTGDYIEISEIFNIFPQKYGYEIDESDLKNYINKYNSSHTDRILKLIDEHFILIFPSNKEIEKFILQTFAEYRAKSIKIKELQDAFNKIYNCKFDENDLQLFVKFYNSESNDTIISIKNEELIQINLFFANEVPNGYLLNFSDSSILNKMGATWFVSYSYFENIDYSHRNWERVSTWPSRKSNYRNSLSFHELWLKQVLLMDDTRLNTNEIGLDSKDVKRMAKEILIKIL